jgi:hypothetical protein
VFLKLDCIDELPFAHGKSYNIINKVHVQIQTMQFCNKMQELQVQVTDQPLTSLRVMDTGRIAAVGSADGTTTIVQFSDGLVDIQPNEKQALTSVSCCTL